jgi:hypothetical protein
LDCIEAIVAKTNSTEIQGVYLEEFPKKKVTTYTSDLNQRLPEANSGGFWRFSGLSHKGGDDYFVDAMLRGTRGVSQKTFVNEDFSLSIGAASKAPLGVHRVSDEPGSLIDDGSAYVVQNYSKENRGFLGAVGIYGGYENESLDCLMSGDNLCANRHAIPEGVSFSVVVRLSSSPSGWMHGRLDAPEIFIDPILTKPAIRLSISGSTTRVPAIGITRTWQSLPPSLQTTYSNGGFPGTKYGCRWCSSDPLENTLIGNPSSSGVGAINELKTWLPLIGDKSSADINTWSIRTLSKDEMNGADACFSKSNQINGILMTNASVYSAGPPSFSGGTLNYQVTAPHFMSNGDVLKGQYNLLMRSDVARCIYKFTSAPVSAEVSIINSSGVAQIATVLVGERNGWLYLKANNFEFSSPVVQVKLTQAAAPVAKKVSITCVKGKTSKKVTAAKPKCPTGYKKK